MADVFVVNASPIITLDKIGAVSLLARLADQVVVPRCDATNPAVFDLAPGFDVLAHRRW